MSEEIKKKRIVLYVDERYIKIVEELVHIGMYNNQNELFRDILKKEAIAKGIDVEEKNDAN